MKLKSSIPSNSVKLIDLYNKIISDSLILGPDFQRKLVWKKQHKFAFIETILLNFPFPEIYIASEEVDVESLKAREIVVDGKQRLSSIVDYIQKRNDFSNQTKIRQFDDLSLDEKKDFLNYLITVKDLKDIGEPNIIEVFKRINSTNYSLNSNEILNAEYGGGEFAILCKQLVDEQYNPTTSETDIVIEKETKSTIVSFFEKNKIFSDNDVKRMFDAQFIMLLISTSLDGKYFGRSTRINYFLEKYNSAFDSYDKQLGEILNSISIINKLHLSVGSYWFNKANLFTLMIELKEVNCEKLNIELLEIRLLDLENKLDLYFNGNEEDLKLLTQDEIKYFEVSRQGSHELAAREHRGKVVKSIINDSIIELQKSKENFLEIEEINQEFLKEKGIPFSILVPTETGLNKSIMDAVSSVREFLKLNSFHNYDVQEYGPSHKIKIKSYIVLDKLKEEIEISLYRSNGRGDYRIWLSDIKPFVNANENLALINNEGKLEVLNISRYDYRNIDIMQ